MVWYLIFCSHVNGGVVCLPPQVILSKKACLFVGRQLVVSAAIEGFGNFRCAGARP